MALDLSRCCLGVNAFPMALPQGAGGPKGNPGIDLALRMAQEAQAMFNH